MPILTTDLLHTLAARAAERFEGFDGARKGGWGGARPKQFADHGGVFDCGAAAAAGVGELIKLGFRWPR